MSANDDSKFVEIPMTVSILVNKLDNCPRCKLKIG